MRQAVILAGGMGTRLRTRLGTKPKPLVDIGGKPLIERQIDLLRRYGLTKLLVLVSYGADQIIEYCTRAGNWNIDIQFVNDEEALGTAGATLAAFRELEAEFLVLYGDTMLDVDLGRFYSFHTSRQNVAGTLFVHPNDHPSDSDLVEVDDEDRITAFRLKPHPARRVSRNLVNAALYVLRRDALLAYRQPQRTQDFAKDVFPAMLVQGELLLAYNSTEYIKDCGTPERLDKVRLDFESGRIERCRMDVLQSAVFLDRDGTINREVDHLTEPSQVELFDGVPRAIRRLNNSEYRTIVVTNQPVLARGDCTREALGKIHATIEGLLGAEGAYLDRIYYCPHHPTRGFSGEIRELKIECACRKPKTGMIERAVRDLNVAVEKSWLIGDTSVDIATARTAGLRSILVETGYAGLDCRHWITPDFTVPDLAAAVDFILEHYEMLCATCSELAREIRPGDFVFIGGLARSGKSNLANCLRDSLRRSNREAVVLSLDRWLLDLETRGPTVLGRYDLPMIRDLLAMLSCRSPLVNIDLPSYDKLTQRRIPPPHEKLSVRRADVVIIEGTIALSLLDVVPMQRRHAWFVEINESERHKRVIREYELRGKKRAEAEAIYQARQNDETSVILEGARAATHRIPDYRGSAASADVNEVTH